MKLGSISVVNWNVGGARCLKQKPDERRKFCKELNDLLRKLLKEAPEVVTLQEVVEYSEDGISANATNVLDLVKKNGHSTLGVDDGASYNFYPCWLVDNHRHSHQGKWNDVIKEGEWTKNGQTPYFAQGNAILVKSGIDLHPVWDLPKNSKRPGPIGNAVRAHGHDFIEHVPLNAGLYFGNRDTEPRNASVAHIVLRELHRDGKLVCELEHPLDVFFVNLHLTTLSMERDGVPDVEKDAEGKRLRQLDIVLNQIVSPYNRWRREGFPIRGKHLEPSLDQTHTRYHPLWVIAGDFNFTPESTEYHRMVRRGFLDLLSPAEKAAPIEKRPHTKARGEGERPTHTLDYIFAGPLFQSVDPVAAETITEGNHVWNNPGQHGVSDHYPLVYQIPISLGEPCGCKHCPEGGG